MNYYSNLQHFIRKYKPGGRVKPTYSKDDNYDEYLKRLAIWETSQVSAQLVANPTTPSDYEDLNPYLVHIEKPKRK